MLKVRCSAAGRCLRVPEKPWLMKTAVLQCVESRALRTNAVYVSLDSLFLTLSVDTVGVSLRFPVSLQGIRRRSEASSVALLTSVSAKLSCGTTVTYIVVD